MKMMPKNAHVIDAVYFPDMMYKGVDTEEKNFRWFSKLSMEKQNHKHDKILSSLDKWEDPWVFVFQLDLLILPGSLDLATHVWPQVWPTSRLQDRAPGWRPESAHRARSIR